MTKVIIVENCATCHWKDHKGGFGAVGYIPYCRIGSPTGRPKDLPYDVGAGIPDWCPLEDR